MENKLEFFQKFSKILKKDTQKLFVERTQIKCKKLFYEKFDLDKAEGKAFPAMLRGLKNDLKNAGELGDFEKRIPVVETMSNRIKTYFKNKEEQALFNKENPSDLKEWKKELQSIQQDLDLFVDSMTKKQKEIEKEIMTQQRMSGDTIEEVHANLGLVEILVTNDMKSVFGDALSSEGLKFRLKGLTSLKRKITSEIRSKYAHDPVLADQIVDLFVCKNDMHDCIRYTAITEPENTTEDYSIWDKKLQNKGYMCIRRKNFWLKNGAYKGINTLYCTPYGYYVEIQLHSKDSLDVKEKIHKLYEEQRDDDTSVERKQELEIEMKKLTDRIKTPKNIKQITDFEDTKAFSTNKLDTSELKKRKLIS